MTGRRLRPRAVGRVKWPGCRGCRSGPPKLVHLEPWNVTLFGNRVFQVCCQDEVRQEQGGPSIQRPVSPVERRGHRGAGINQVEREAALGGTRPQAQGCQGPRGHRKLERQEQASPEPPEGQALRTPGLRPGSPGCERVACCRLTPPTHLRGAWEARCRQVTPQP